MSEAKSKLAVAVATAVLLLSAAAQADAPAATVKATDNLKFEPSHVTVSVGDTVVWKNSSVLLHSVTDVPAKAVDKNDVALPEGAKPFNSGLLDPGANFRHTFPKPGTYKYFCIPHEPAGMVGTVVVKSAQ